MTNPHDLKYLSVEELQPAEPSVGHGASRTASDVTHATAERVKTGSRTAWDATTSVVTTLMSTTQSLLTLRLSEGLNDLLQNLVKGSEFIYDKAMVAEDLAAQAGSSAYHRLFDEDSIVREGLARFRDSSEA